MITIEVPSTQLARSRMVFSPVQEIVASVRLLQQPGAQTLHRAWIETAWPRLADFDLSVLLALIRPSGYVPDFLTPTLGTTRPTLHQELACVARTEPEQLRADIWRMSSSVSDGLQTA